MPGRERVARYLPAILALLAGATYAGWRMGRAGWDPLALAELGDRYSEGSSEGDAGYDGQFNYFLALDPSPASVSARLDVPAYRYQRILYPLLARALAFGQPGWIPWALLGLNLLAHAMGTGCVAAWLRGRGLNRLYALTYGLWVGLLAPVGLDLNEPLSYALIAAAWLLWQRSRPIPAAACLGLALFAKETALIFWAAALAGSLMGDRDRRYAAALVVAGLAYTAWQAWLFAQYGQIGLVSGGDLATPFEWIPFMGLWRIGGVSLRALALFVVIFGPTVVLPAVWGALHSLRALAAGARGPSEFALLFSSAFIMALPFSTFREPLGLVRAMDGLVLAVLCFAAERRAAGAPGGWLRVLRYTLLWSALLVILLNG